MTTETENAAAGGANASVPHEVSQRITLKLLSWFLRRELPRVLPEQFDSAPKVVPHNAQGWSNYTFLVTHRGTAYVVRMKRVQRDEIFYRQWADYHKEEWILRNLPSEVPVPRAVQRGIGYVEGADGQHEYAYMVQSFLPCAARSQPLSFAERLKLLCDLGGLGRMINSTPTAGCGHRYDPLLNRFVHQDWPQFLQREIDACRVSELTARGILSASQCTAALDRLYSLGSLNQRPTLFHRDFLMNWSNVLSDDIGRVCGIIDWELAGSGPGLHYELASALYVLHRDAQDEAIAAAEFGALLNGYGMSIDEFESCYRRDVETVVLLTAIGKVHRYIALAARGELQHSWRMNFARRAEDLVRSLADGHCMPPHGGQLQKAA